MPTPLKEKVSLASLRSARDSGQKLAMLTCYDFTTARLMQEAGVPSLLVGDSAANVILGYSSTIPAPLDFMIEITAAVRRGAPLAFLVGDMPFGSYQASVSQGVKNTCRMFQATGCDCVKMELTAYHLPLVRALTAAGVPVMPHLGLRPQSVGVLGGYKYQGRTCEEATSIVALALRMQEAGAVAILLEAVPPEVANAVIERTNIPIVGCGAGSGCHASVIVTQDGLGLTSARPRFVPALADLATPLREAFAKYAQDLASGAYPAPQHLYTMPPAEQAKLKDWLKQQ
ncbi:MAG: 3-methyl-2-oxobutanoate hydroxymethyltransferase [Bacillota bacterium]